MQTGSSQSLEIPTSFLSYHELAGRIISGSEVGSITKTIVTTTITGSQLCSLRTSLMHTSCGKSGMSSLGYSMAPAGAADWR
jgi:hypothetical protein